VLDGVTWRVGPGDRIGVVGGNGAGKTTLLRVLAGELAPDPGTLRVGRTVRAGHLSQDLAGLPDSLRLLEAVEEVARRVRIGDRELTAAQLAEVFGFTGERVWTPVADLSGGERRRLQLLRLLAGEPNVLLLDEPTNDLDIDTLAALEDLLDSWPGTLVVASHDRYLVERVTDSVFGMAGDGRLRHLPGGVDDYLAWPAEAAPPPAGSRSGGGVAGRAAGRDSGPDRHGEETPADPPAGRARAARKELARLERQLARLALRESSLHEQQATYATDYPRLAELEGQLREVRVERSLLEDAWLALADRTPDR
jgi:ABC-type Mn2+/Zn2+ transport system ATPase subunit